MANKLSTVTGGATYCVYLKGVACSDAFIDDYCLKYFLIRLCNGLKPFQVKLHAYGMFSNEGYLLVTPTTSTGLGLLIKSICETYNSYFSQRFERESLPLGNCIKIVPVNGNKLTMDSQKYIERKVLDEGISAHAGAYEWSSYTANSFGCRSRMVTPHPAFRRYLNISTNSYKTYREFIAEPFNCSYLAYIDRQVKSGRPIAKGRMPASAPVRVRRVAIERYSQSIWL